MFPEKPKDPLTNKEWRRYKRSTKCHICFKSFNSKDPKVRDHCHYTGHYRGPTHRSCSLRYQIPSYILVIAHNSAHYDTHLFSKELGEHFENIGVIAKTKRNTLPFQLRLWLISTLIDKKLKKKNSWSLGFKLMATSLDSLVKNLVGCAPPGGNGGDSRASAGQRLEGFEKYLESQYKLLTRKRYMTSIYMNT